MANVPFYKATQISPRTWQIQYDFMKREGAGVFSYLLEGKNYALVIDTMLGYGHLPNFCQTLTDKPLKLVNTHFHFDHTAGNFDFDSCYIHPLDMPFFYSAQPASREQVLERAKQSALPEYAPQLSLDDFTAEAPMKTYPINDGDLFDLGDRQLEVIWVGGHSPGSIVLLDRAQRICYSGDACNSNTLLGFKGALSIEEYLVNLLNLKKFQPAFDILYGGHQVLAPSVIDEGIELCGRVIAGTDDHEERPGLGGRMTVYGAKHAEVGFGRADGKSFNISYNPENILKKPHVPQVIDNKVFSLF